MFPTSPKEGLPWPVESGAPLLSKTITPPLWSDGLTTLFRAAPYPAELSPRDGGLLPLQAATPRVAATAAAVIHIALRGFITRHPPRTTPMDEARRYRAVRRLRRSRVMPGLAPRPSRSSSPRCSSSAIVEETPPRQAGARLPVLVS